MAVSNSSPLRLAIFRGRMASIGVESISLIRPLIRMLLVAYLVTAILAQDPAILQVRVVDGEGAVYAIGTRATRGVTVQVTDETGKPVEGASISFRLPEEG